MSEQLLLTPEAEKPVLYDQDAEIQQAEQAQINPEAVAARAAADQLEAEFEGAHSKLYYEDKDGNLKPSNRHTYKIDEKGNTVVMKRADALAKADELNDLREKAEGPAEKLDMADLYKMGVEELSKATGASQAEIYKNGKTDAINKYFGYEKPAETDEEPAFDPAAFRRPGDIGSVSIPKRSAEVDASEEAEKPRTIDSMIEDWAKAETESDEAKSKEIQDEIQEYLIDAQARGVFREEEVSAIIDSIYNRKEASKEERQKALLELRDKIAEVVARKEGKPMDDEGVKPLTDEELAALDEMDVELDDDEIEPLSDEELAALDALDSEEDLDEETKAKGFRARLHAIKNAIVLLPAKIVNRERSGEPMSGKKKTMLALGVIGAAVAGVVIAKYGLPKIGGKREITGNMSDDLTDRLSRKVNNPVDVPPVAPPKTPESLNIDTTQYSWDVANQMNPGNEVATMQGAIDKYNAAHGTNFALTPHNGSTWIMDGGRSIYPDEMEELNKLMNA